ncbi:hypothetical protein BC833DRAFT_592787 [Globomyces pollinis-pini]|nr:hypothetical protein BC833DRAFT_592787 [Globomyces pollinis-pini]
MMIKLLSRFVVQKLALNINQQIGIVLLSTETIWHLSYTNDLQKILSHIKEINNQVLQTTDIPWNPKSLIESILPIDEECIMRVIFIYSRSYCIPDETESLMKSHFTQYPNFFLDLLYLHEKPTATNNVQKVFDSLGYMESKASRSYENSKPKSQRLLLMWTELLGHPIHRSSIVKCHYWEF